MEQVVETYRNVSWVYVNWTQCHWFFDDDDGGGGWDGDDWDGCELVREFSLNQKAWSCSVFDGRRGPWKWGSLTLKSHEWWQNPFLDFARSSCPYLIRLLKKNLWLSGWNGLLVTWQWIFKPNICRLLGSGMLTCVPYGSGRAISGCLKIWKPEINNPTIHHESCSRFIWWQKQHLHKMVRSYPLHPAMVLLFIGDKTVPAQGGKWPPVLVYKHHYITIVYSCNFYKPNYCNNHVIIYH